MRCGRRRLIRPGEYFGLSAIKDSGNQPAALWVVMRGCCHCGHPLFLWACADEMRKEEADEAGGISLPLSRKDVEMVMPFSCAPLLSFSASSFLCGPACARERGGLRVRVHAACVCENAQCTFHHIKAIMTVKLQAPSCRCMMFSLVTSRT